MLSRRTLAGLAAVLPLALVCGSADAGQTMRDLRALGAPEMFEAAMLVCFSLSWPVKLAKLLRVKRADGLSPSFLSLILAGYASGILAKVISYWGGAAPPYGLMALYALNGAMVAAALGLTLRYGGAETAAS